jgi:hypothetical protein
MFDELRLSLHSTSFQSAVRILSDCEAQAGAVLRSKFALLKAFEEIGTFDKAKDVMEDVTKALCCIG